jgi:hypothetical protein
MAKNLKPGPNQQGMILSGDGGRAKAQGYHVLTGMK